MSLSYRFDSAEWVAGGYHFGDRGLGVRGADIPADGTDGGSIMANDVQPGDEDKEFRARLSRWPTLGSFALDEDGSFTYEGAADYAEYFLDVDGQQVDGPNADDSTTVTFGGSDAAMEAGHGVFVLAGQAVGLRAGRALQVVPGVYVLAGQDAGLAHAAPNRLDAQAGMFVLQGGAVDLRTARVLPAAHGAFSIQGQAISMRPARVLRADLGGFVLQGQAVHLIVASPNRLAAQPGSFALLGGALHAVAQRVLRPAAGQFAIEGRDVVFGSGRAMSAEHGTFLIDGGAAQFRRTRHVVAACGMFAVSGQQVQFTWSGMPVPQRDFSRDISHVTVPIVVHHVSYSTAIFAVSGSDDITAR